MPFTKTELITDALLDLSEISAEESPSDNVFALAKRKYDAWYANQQQRDRLYWDNTDDVTAEIPDEVYLAVTAVLAGLVAPALRTTEPVVPDDTSGTPIAISTWGRRELARLLKRPSSDLPVQADYF